MVRIIVESARGADLPDGEPKEALTPVTAAAELCVSRVIPHKSRYLLAQNSPFHFSLFPTNITARR